MTTPNGESGTPRVIETFRTINDYELGRIRQDDPSCFNGHVSIRKYRVTVEIVDEPKDVLIERIRKLWGECDNHHHWQPLQATAKTLGIKLDLKDVGHKRK